MKIKINVDYKTNIEGLNKQNKADGKPEITKDEAHSDLTMNYLRFAVEKKYKEGLEGQLRRVWGRIERKFEAAIENKTYKVELEEAEKDFIKKAHSEANYPVNITKYVNIFEDSFTNKLDETKDEK